MNVIFPPPFLQELQCEVQDVVPPYGRFQPRDVILGVWIQSFFLQEKGFMLPAHPSHHYKRDGLPKPASSTEVFGAEFMRPSHVSLALGVYRHALGGPRGVGEGGGDALISKLC